MSDSIDELSKAYMENVWETHARSVGLFPIPEYPEYEAERGMWSTALEVLLTTLRYIAPATLLTLFWGQQSFLFKLLKYIDSAVRSLIFSSEEQKQAVLQWLGEAGPVRVDKLDVVWRQGWIVCGVLDAALPGACAGHPPTKLSLKHAQTIADNYLGVEPAFSRQELESNNTLSRHQEWKLINYLENIRLAISKITPPTPIKSANPPTQRRTTPEVQHSTLDYIARGSGLIAAQLKNKAYFKIYPTAQQSLDPGEINILIHGPRDTYGIAVLPPILGKAQMIRQNLLGLQSKTSYTENVLPITQGTTYLRSYGNNNINKTFYIPKTKYDIDIDIELTQDHARIGYIASLEGKYEISITTRGQNIVGSPFTITASNNIVGNLERDSFCLEDGEEIDIVDIKTDRKVVLRIVDFVSEKMLLKENGTFEKITEEEAQHLMQTENVSSKNKGSCKVKNKKDLKLNHFYYTARKVIILNRICKIFQDVDNKNLLFKKKKIKHNLDYRQQQGIPDILNSTIHDSQSTTQNLLEKRNRIIVPENLSVSLLTEKSNALAEDQPIAHTSDIDKSADTGRIMNYHLLKTDPLEDDTISVDTAQSSSNNPFINDLYDQSYAIEKGLGSFILNEYETHNSQNEETENLAAKLFIDSQFKMNNPFIDNVELERPKTPVYKIISGALTNRGNSVYIDPEKEHFTPENICSIKNPFIKHEAEVTELYQEKPDFIIGAPVSLPPVNLISSTASTKTNIEKLKNTEKKIKPNKKNEKTTNTTMDISTNSNSSEQDPICDHNFSSLDSNSTQDIIIIPRRSLTPTTISQSSREMSPKKDTWDSAYVSIDDNNCISDNNISNELVNEPLHKRRSPFSEELSKMGPAEREIWQCDTELKDVSYIDDDYRQYKCDAKRLECTPIIEENERNVTSEMKEDTIYRNMTITDSVAQTFAELDDIYDKHHTSSEIDSTTTTSENKLQNLSVEYTVETNNIFVDSASEIVTDVKRHAKKLEGEISEVQVNATESVSVSQTLRVCDFKNYQEQNNNDEIQFGDRIFSNIVLEKKKYWDDKIRQIEAKSEEIRVLQNKRKSTSKHLRRNDSISKRKGKKIVQQLLKSGQEDYDIFTKSNTQVMPSYETSERTEGTKLLELSKNKTTEPNKFTSPICNERKPEMSENESLPEPSNKSKETSDSYAMDEIVDNKIHISHSILQLKQELSEKVFQAFETSPKRFFGTSRKHILNKIDTFLTSPDDNEETKEHASIVNRESGLVSSRISLFHNISQIEDVPRLRYRKSKSMHNISRQDNETSPTSFQISKNTKSPVKIENRVINENGSTSHSNTTISNQFSSTPLQEKRARLTQNINNKSFDDSLPSKSSNFENGNDYVKRTINVFNKQIDTRFQSSASKLKTISKSETDIFHKSTSIPKDNDLDKYKSCEELPKVSVKNFISLYEDVTKTSNTSSPVKINNNVTKPTWSPNNQLSSFIQGTTNKLKIPSTETVKPQSLQSKPKPFEHYSSPCRSKNTSPEGGAKIDSCQSTGSSLDIDIVSNQDQETNYLSLSDIEIEIIDKDLEKQETVHEPETAHLEYKNRFTLAKKFFQSLEELREEKTIKKLSTNDISEKKHSIESLENSKRSKRSNIKKSHSMPSSEISKVWNEMQEQKEENKKLIKISEKFNVDDLFEDVMEGRLSRQGSLRGIPHKKAVLETFRSMENITDSTLNSYEIAESQLGDFADDKKSRSAQSYLTEYPYLPTTDPSKYHSRLDVSASGLITFKELRNIPRRNSVPDLRLNPKFTADL